MKTGTEMQKEAIEFWEQKQEENGYDDSAKWPFICGSLTAIADREVQLATNIKLEDDDYVEVTGRTIAFYEKGKRSYPKGSVYTSSHFAHKKLIRTLIEDWYGEDTNWYNISLDDLMVDD